MLESSIHMYACAVRPLAPTGLCPQGFELLMNSLSMVSNGDPVFGVVFLLP
jgi:hypothetical protein